MWRRSLAKCAVSGAASDPDMATSLDACTAMPEAAGLSLATPDFHVEANHAILVADGHNRNTSRDVIFRTNDLLRGLRNVCGVGKREIVFHLLFNIHGWTTLSWGCFRGHSFRIDLDPAVAKQSLRPVVQCRI